MTVGDVTEAPAPVAKQEIRATPWPAPLSGSVSAEGEPLSEQFQPLPRAASLKSGLPSRPPLPSPSDVTFVSS